MNRTRIHADQGQYYSHGINPYPYDYTGYAQVPDRASGQGLSGLLDAQGSTLKLGLAAGAAYHAYRRYGSAAAGLIVGLLGWIAPLPVTALTVYQASEDGFAKPASKKVFGDAIGRIGAKGAKGAV